MTGITGNAAFDAVMDKLGVSSSTAAQKKTQSNDTLDQSSFLKLLTAQLKNQDPFKPVENEQMVAQMAQISSVQGIAEMNATMKTMASKFDSGQTASATSYVGKAVLSPGNVVWPHADGTFEGFGTLDKAASDVQVTISDGNGQTVRTLSLGAQKAGEFAINWDGLDGSGQEAGAGPFKIQVIANRSDGNVEIKPLVWAPVTSIKLPADGSSPVLSVAGIGDVALSAVRQVG